jgi:transcription elongation GreA/GreB family factor
VHLRAADGGTQRTVTFLGPFETDVDQGIYNYRAPMSQKLMGATVGERVHLMLDGRDTEYEVLRIESGLNA